MQKQSKKNTSTHLSPQEVKEAWSLFVNEFKKIPEGRGYRNTPQANAKRELLRKIFAYRKGGRNFSIMAIYKLTNIDRATVRMYRDTMK